MTGVEECRGVWLKVEEKKGGEGSNKRREREREREHQARRSKKHETRISLSITYALNPGIYASGINARSLGLPPAGSSRLHGCGVRRTESST